VRTASNDGDRPGSRHLECEPCGLTVHARDDSSGELSDKLQSAGLGA
jgi:hypothetical protein